jgi:hypothetical protein
LKINRNKPIPTNIAKMKNKAKMKPKRTMNQMTTQMQSFWNKEPNHKEVNQEDLLGRADPCRDSNLT